MIASNPDRFPCHVPATVEEALAQKASIEGLTPIAGGTEVMVLFNEGLISPRPMQSLHRLAPVWKRVAELPDGSLSIGALATYTDVRHHAAVRQWWPMLVESARVTGALQIQNRGTLVGNVVNGSPAADTVPPLMAYGARLRLLSTAGERVVDLDGFYTGYRKSLLRADELVSELILPRPAAGTREYFRKVGTRAAQAISKVVVAGTRTDKAVRLVWGSIGPTTMRTPRTEAAVLAGATPEAACEVLASEIAPMDDIRSTKVYRLGVSRNLLKDFMAATARA